MLLVYVTIVSNGLASFAHTATDSVIVLLVYASDGLAFFSHTATDCIVYVSE